LGDIKKFAQGQKKVAKRQDFAQSGHTDPSRYKACIHMYKLTYLDMHIHPYYIYYIDRGAFDYMYACMYNPNTKSDPQTGVNVTSIGFGKVDHPLAQNLGAFLILIIYRT
jgi:hypothetical protein